MKHQHTAVNPDDNTDRVQPSHWNQLHIFVAQAEPDDPEAGTSVPWMSNGTGLGDEGDIMVKVNVGGTIKYCTLCDFSNASTPVADKILTEDGFDILTEDGDSILGD